MSIRSKQEQKTILPLAFCLAWIVGVSVAHGAAPQRVVSANLCADQLLMALADADQIASLSPLATDPSLSYFANAANQFPQNRGTGEDIVRLDADLVLTGPYDSAITRSLLATRGIAFDIIAPWTDFESGEAALIALADHLGHKERGLEWVARIEHERQKVQALRTPILSAGTPRVLPLHRRGYVYHAGLTGQILHDAGVGDATGSLSLRGAGFATLEDILVAQPDYLLVADSHSQSPSPMAQDSEAEDQGQAFLNHPALRHIWTAQRRLVVPDRLSICEGPATPGLIATLGAQIRSKILKLQGP